MRTRMGGRTGYVLKSCIAAVIWLGSSIGVVQAADAALAVEKLSPKIRVVADLQEVPRGELIPYRKIEPYLRNFLVMSRETFLEDSHPIRQASMSRFLDRRIFAVIDQPIGTVFDLVRLGQRLHTQEKPRKGLGYIVTVVGAARVVERSEEVAVLEVSNARYEVDIQDRLMLQPSLRVQDLLVTTPKFYFPRSEILALISGFGAHQSRVAVVNVGANDGLEAGDLLDIFLRESQNELKGIYEKSPKAKAIKKGIRKPFDLSERAAKLLVFRVFDQVSYGILREKNQKLISTGDYVY